MWANAHRDGHWPTFFKCGQIQVAPSVQRREVLLMPTTRVPCSNVAKTQNLLKFAEVLKTPEWIAAVNGPKFAIL